MISPSKFIFDRWLHNRCFRSFCWLYCFRFSRFKFCFIWFWFESCSYGVIGCICGSNCALIFDILVNCIILYFYVLSLSLSCNSVLSQFDGFYLFSWVGLNSFNREVRLRWFVDSDIELFSELLARSVVDCFGVDCFRNVQCHIIRYNISKLWELYWYFFLVN